MHPPDQFDSGVSAFGFGAKVPLHDVRHPKFPRTIPIHGIGWRGVNH
jgi:hypothetical protein